MTLTLTDQLWQTAEEDYPKNGSEEEQLTFLARYAALAPSSHNSQPWEFSITDGAIEIQPATERWLRQADPDQREFYLSLGCALENLLTAAAHFGFQTRTETATTDDGGTSLRVHLDSEEKPSQEDDNLFDAITLRRTYHKQFAPLPLDAKHTKLLRDLITEDSIHLVFLEGATGPKKEFGKIMAKADESQFADREYRQELAEWFGAGIFGDGPLRARIGKWVIKHRDIGEKQAKEDQDRITNAAAIALLATDETDHEAQIQCGRAFERMALAGVPLGIGTQPLSQPLETEDLRAEVQSLLPSQSMHVQHAFRLGYPAEQEEHTPRFPMDEIIK
jgi:nitroreductase